MKPPQSQLHCIPQIVYGIEILDNALIEAANPLLQKHWREIAHYPDIPLDVDWDGYMDLQNRECILFFTARMKIDGSLAGYYVVITPPRNLHYKTSKQALNDVLFVDPDLRKFGIGLELIDFGDRHLAGLGYQVIHQHVKAAHDFGPMLERRLGYELVDKIYARRLDRLAERSVAGFAEVNDDRQNFDINS